MPRIKRNLCPSVPLSQTARHVLVRFADDLLTNSKDIAGRIFARLPGRGSVFGVFVGYVGDFVERYVILVILVI